MMDDNGALVSGAWKRLDWIIEECEKRSLYVVLDLHGAPGGQSSMDHCGEADGGAKLWKYDAWQQKTIRLWECIATRYRNCSTVAMYDLMNEPDKVSAANLEKLHKKIYEAIRRIDPDHIISIEGAWAWNMLPDPEKAGFENVIYQMHFYAMQGEEASSWDAQNGMIETKLRELAEYQQKWQVPLYVGEFNVFAFEDLWEKFITGFQQEKIHWSNWTYKVSSNYGNWGLYNSSSATAPNVSLESKEQIKEKWSRFSTDTFRENTSFQEMLRRCLK